MLYSINDMYDRIFMMSDSFDDTCYENLLLELISKNTPSANLDLSFLLGDVDRIDKYAFSDTNYNSIPLPESVTSIGDYAFEYCRNLTSISLPQGVTEIGEYAFNWCENLALTSLPSSLISIGRAAFQLCDIHKLTVLPENIKVIKEYAFQSSGIISITFTGKPDSIGNNAFNCPNLTTINVPWSEGEVEGAPWGATNATINYNYVYVRNEIIYEDGSFFYYKNGELQSGNGLVELVDDNGDIYYIYVRSNGKLATGKFYATVTNGYFEEGVIEFGDDARYYPNKFEEPEEPEIPEVKNGIYEEYGVLVYYINGEMASGAGLIYHEGTPRSGFICVRSNGLLALGRFSVNETQTNGYMRAGVYNFGEYGFMTTPLVSVTQNLTNVTSSWSYPYIAIDDYHSNATSTPDYSMSTTLTAESGYTLNSVSVEMGGRDITASVYDGAGNINIPAVTGIVVITATAI